MEFLINTCSDRAHIVLLGDFNLDYDCNARCPVGPSSAKFFRIFSDLNLENKVLEPTRSGSVLDLILCSKQMVADVQHLPPFHTSDHMILKFRCSFPALSSVMLPPIPNFYKADFIALNQYLASINWWQVFQNYLSVDDLYKRFCLVMYEGFKNFVPFSFLYKAPPKYPRHILNLLQQKSRLSFDSSSALYRKVCFDINFHIKKFHAYYERKLKKKASSRHFFWIHSA